MKQKSFHKRSLFSPQFLHVLHCVTESNVKGNRKMSNVHLLIINFVEMCNECEVKRYRPELKLDYILMDAVFV